MSYFNEIPNVQFNNRTKNELSNDEFIVIKNFFKKAKIREDIISVATAFEYYSITSDERPDQVAERFYGDAELDWVIMLTNNIINLQDDWPLNLDSFYKFMIDKYGSEEAFTDIHHYETLSVVDGFEREVLPAGLQVDESFYNAPEYETVEENPSGINFPPIILSGTQAVLTPVTGLGATIVSVTINNAGAGYSFTPSVFLSAPPVTSNASASVLTQDFNVSSVVSLNGGVGYNNPPQVIISDPPTSTQASAESVLNQTSISGITSLVGGIGYGLTAPTVTFEAPPNVWSEAGYLTASQIEVSDGMEGIYVREDGAKIYTSGIGVTTGIREYTLSNPWVISSISETNILNVSTDFGYTTGIELSPDGEYMYVSGGQSGSYKVISYLLSTPWDISTATKSETLSTFSSGGVRLKYDGTVLYMLDLSVPDAIKQYTLSTPWDLSTRSGSITGQYNVQTATGDNNLLGFTFFGNGSKMFAVGSDNQSVFEFDLSTPWDVTTASYKVSYYVGDKMSQPTDVYVKSDRTMAFIGGNLPGNENKIHQYAVTSTATGESTVSNSSVVNIAITNAGFGYTTPPLITIGSPYTQVTATADASILSGVVTSITITNAGFGYTSQPNVSISSAPVSTNAIFSVIMDADAQSISGVRIIDGGSNYVNSPSFVIQEPGNILNVEVGDTYSQNSKTWRWNGTNWQEKITDELQYFNPVSSSVVKIVGNKCSKPVTNYEYESNLNDAKRQILILRREYLSVIITDLRNAMKYNRESIDYIEDDLKTAYNPKLYGV